MNLFLIFNDTATETIYFDRFRYVSYVINRDFYKNKTDAVPCEFCNPRKLQMTISILISEDNNFNAFSDYTMHYILQIVY